ncbi:MAG TPA: exodeoxyribonuclease VII large subunit [Burkholderiales bacterium]|nr:exodeoxyribonuclease VII large subunit [Burkholderiales bacterium]
MPSSPSPSREPPVLPVSELNRRVRELLETTVPLLWVSGEISNFTRATSGHWYFSLKDANAQVRCVMFRHKSQYLDWAPQNGMQVEARVVVTLYEPRGDYQLNVESIRRAGLGVLYERFERLKAMLAAEGLFADERKKPLPPFPKRIGVITSSAGAALHDVLTTLRRRSPGIPVIVYPTPVQGEGAAAKIAAAIRAAGERNECDVLILCRGGGSIEDLWQFNEELVARTIAACPIPIVCGVGHETDFTIADFVADRRAPTPTGAAELVSPNNAELRRQLESITNQLQRQTWRAIEARMQHLDNLSRRLVHPGERLRRQGEDMTRLANQLSRAANVQLQKRQWQMESLKVRLTANRPDIGTLINRQQTYADRLRQAMRRRLENMQSEFATLQAQLSHLNPDNVLDRGYSIVMKEDGAIVKDADQLAVEESVTMKFSRGGATGKVTRVS